MPNKRYNAHKDTLFTQSVSEKFSFNEQVATVFDDMITRSVPFYKQTLELCVEFLALHLSGLNGVKTPRVYDIGCSNGNLLIGLAQKLCEIGVKSECIGIDNSKAMIQSAKLKAKAYNAKITFECVDCLQSKLLECSAIVSNYTLQFIRPPLRAGLITKIYNALHSGGIFIMSEKMASVDRLFDSQMITLYHNYKARNGYSQTQIAKKREALENVLVPYSLEENVALLKDAGFKSVEVLFKWVNFGTLIARKG
ncbi:carboxy-S-adenosyl-L-methionine synthase CmoA [Helicobacter sp. 23-1048]